MENPDFAETSKNQVFRFFLIFLGVPGTGSDLISMYGAVPAAGDYL